MKTTDQAGRNIDLIIEELNFGKFQIITLCICLAVIIIDELSGNLFVFTTIEPEYRCKISDCEDSRAVYSASWVKEAIPLDARSELQKCSRFAIKDALNSSAVNNCSLLEFNKSSVIGCDERVYGKGESLVNEFDLGCQEWKPPLIGTLRGIGSLIGLSLVGFLSDKFGRKYLIVFSLLIRGLMGIIHVFAPDYWSYTFLEFFITVLTVGSYSAAYILGAELLSSKHRVMGTMLISLATPVSLLLQGFVAMGIPYWRTFMCVVYIPPLLFVICTPIIDESIRWLVIRQRYSDAIALIEKAARYNNIKFTENAHTYIEDLRSGTMTQAIQENEEKVPFVAIFRSARLMVRLFVCAFCWIINVLVYYALTINSISISFDNMYLNYLLVNGSEFVSILVYYFTIDRFGRKICLSGSLVLCGIMCGAYVLTPAGMNVLALVFYMASKLFISFSFNLIYMYTSELFPTTLRHTCVAFCSMIGRLGSILAPQTALMSKWHSSLPMALFAFLAICSGVSALTFPETLNTKLPETIAEAEHIKKRNTSDGQTIFDNIKLTEVS